MKWLGALLCISMTTWIGFELGNRLAARPKQIRQFILSLQMLEAEMGYSQLTLQQIFSRIHKKISFPVCSFYEQLAKVLEGVVPDFLHVWDTSVDKLIKQSALQKSEQDIIKQFGRNIGQHTFHQQQKHIKLAIHHLEQELDVAQEQCMKYEKMMKSLGLLIGIFIVLLLL